MRLRTLLAAALLAIAAISACQPAPGGGSEPDAPASDVAPDASATPYAAPGY